MKKILLYLLSLISISGTNAQNLSDIVNNLTLNYYEKVDSIMKDSNIISKSSHGEMKRLRRSMYFWDTRVDEYGTLNRYRDEMNNAIISLKRQQSSRTISNQENWTYFGPKSESTDLEGMGRVQSIWVSEANPDFVLAGSVMGGLWMTTNANDDDAKSVVWKNITDAELIPGGVWSIDVDESGSVPVIYFVSTLTGGASLLDNGNYSYGVYKSNDLGNSWDKIYPITNSLSVNDELLAIKICPNNKNVIILTSKYNIYRTSDGGISWANVCTSNLTQLNPIQFWDIDYDPANYNHIVVSGRFGIAESNNMGISWTLNTLAADILDCSVEFKKIPPYTLYCFFEYDPAQADYLIYWDATNLKWEYACPLPIQSLDITEFFQLQFYLTYSDNFLGGTSDFRFYDLSVDCEQSCINGYYPCSNFHPDTRAITSISVDENIEIIYSGNDGGVLRTEITKETSGDYTLASHDISTNLHIKQHFSVSNTNKKPRVYLSGTIDNGTDERIEYLDGTTWWHQYEGGDGGTVLIPRNNPFYLWGNNGGTHPITLKRCYALYKNSTEKIIPFPELNSPIIQHPIQDDWFYGVTEVYGTCDQKIIRSEDKAETFPFFETTLFGKIYDIEICESEPEYMYASSYIYWDSSSHNGSFKKTNASGVWTVVNSDLLLNSVVNDIPLTDIEVDPNDHKNVWICFGKFSPTPPQNEDYRRIFFSTDGGDSWTNYSFNLPNIPVNKLVYVPEISTLFCGTDLGVYYCEDGSQSWIRYGQGFPIVMVSDLKYNEATKELIAATYGRGLWRIQIHCDEATIATFTPQGSSWSEPSNIVDKIMVIPTGTTFTIENEKLWFAPCTKIIVEHNATLIIRNCTLTSLADRFWNGIKVRGDRNALVQTNQGKLIIEDNSFIENAYKAVEVADYYLFNGGIVEAENSTFRNCRNMVGFNSYPYDNQSHFLNCTFICTDPLVDANYDNKGTNQFVSMWDVHGVEFRGCTFKNEGEYGIYSDDNRGAGIFAIDANFNVYPMDDPNTISEPCDIPDGKINKFIDLAIGISTSSSVGIQNDVKILDNDFINCRIGIESTNDIGNIIVGNNFEWKNGFYLSDAGEELALLGTPIGIYTGSTIDFLAMDNQFIWTEGLTGIPPSILDPLVSVHGIFAGIYTSNSDVQQSTNYSKILKNTFDRQTTNTEKYVVGDYISGTNLKLVIPCNTYNNLNEDDWYIAKYSILNNQAQILLDQKWPKNSFSTTHGCINSFKIYNHYLNNQFDYYNLQYFNDPCFSNVAIQSNNSDYNCDEITLCDVYSFWNGWEGEPGGGGGELPGLKEENEIDPNQDNIFNMIYLNRFEEANLLISKWHPYNDEDIHLKSLGLLAKSIYSDNRNWNSLLDIEIENLYNLTQFEDQAGLMSRQLLTYFASYDFPPKILIINKTSGQRDVPVNFVNLKNKDEIDFDIYPNPTNNQFKIEYRLPAEMQSAIITIFDLNGKKVREFQLTENQGSISVSKSEVGEAGMYQCTISLDKNQKQVKKVLIIE